MTKKEWNEVTLPEERLILEKLLENRGYNIERWPTNNEDMHKGIDCVVKDDGSGAPYSKRVACRKRTIYKGRVDLSANPHELKKIINEANSYPPERSVDIYFYWWFDGKGHDSENVRAFLMIDYYEYCRWVRDNHSEEHIVSGVYYFNVKDVIKYMPREQYIFEENTNQLNIFSDD